MSGRRGPRGSAERVEGLLRMLPWLMSRREVEVAEMARQFGISEDDLVADLEMASMCGMPPYSPFELTEVWIEDGTVKVGVNKHMERRLQLTAQEAFGLGLLATFAQDIPGFRRSRALRSALAKIAKVGGGDEITIDVEHVPHLDLVTDAARTGERVRVVYWTPGSNTESERVLTVRSVFTDRVHWYVTADDDKSGEVRHFRVDRIRAAEGTGEIVDVADVVPAVPNWFSGEGEGTPVTVDLAPSAAWVAEQYPCRSVEERADGTMRVVLVAGTEHWLGRLLLRAGAGATVVSPPQWTDLAARTAASVLGRYRDSSADS